LHPPQAVRRLALRQAQGAGTDESDLTIVPKVVHLSFEFIADFRGAKLAHSSTQALQDFSRSMDGWSAVL
jgi:hypothetical protein